MAALHPTAPCPNTTAGGASDDCTCSSFTGGQDVGCPAFMYAGPCYCLGDLTANATIRTALLDPANATAGVSIYIGGGVAGSGCDTRGTMSVRQEPPSPSLPRAFEPSSRSPPLPPIPPP